MPLPVHRRDDGKPTHRKIAGLMRRATLTAQAVGAAQRLAALEAWTNEDREPRLTAYAVEAKFSSTGERDCVARLALGRPPDLRPTGGRYASGYSAVTQVTQSAQYAYVHVTQM